MRAPYWWWGALLGFFGILLFLRLSLFEKNQGQFWVGSLFLTIIFSIQTFMVFGIPYRIYKSGKRAVDNLIGGNKILLSDVEVYVKSFELFSQRPVAFSSITKTIYNFDVADLLLADSSLILLGKTKFMGSLLFAAPVEMTNGKSKTGLPIASVNNWRELNGRIEIQISDSNYKEIIKIEFKNEIEKLKNWLTVHASFEDQLSQSK